jgi:hypothetical protein
MTSDIMEDPTAVPGFPLRFHRVPLHQGFEDFRTPVSFSTFQSSEPPLKGSGGSTSLLKVLLNCFSESLPAFEPTSPTVLDLAYYPMRIVISEWMLYSQVMARYLAYYEYSLKTIDTAIYEERGDVIDLQKWRHRAIQSQFKIESTKQFVAYQSAQENKHAVWDLIVNDLDQVSRKIEQYGLSLERIIPVVTSIVQLLDSQQSIAESINVKRLTYVALIFIPLSWVASLFSIPGDFAPGQSKFWVYFAVSLPLCIAVITFSLLINLLT